METRQLIKVSPYVVKVVARRAFRALTSTRRLGTRRIPLRGPEGELWFPKVFVTEASYSWVERCFVVVGIVSVDEREMYLGLRCYNRRGTLTWADGWLDDEPITVDSLLGELVDSTV